MSLILLAAFQAAAPATSLAPVPLMRSDFDLADARPADGSDLLTGRQGCRREGSDEILVCGQRPSAGAYPMEEMARLFATRPIAEMALGRGAVGSAFLESAGMDRGAVSTRVMVGIRLPF
jgi:hypothetical protein